MIYKRFTYIPFDGFKDNGEYIMPHTVANLLNEFYEENRKYRSQLNDLKKENEELKKEAEEYNEDAMSYQTLYEQQLEKFEELLSECKHQQEQKMKFYKENEQLKQQVKQLQHWNKCLAEKRHQELSYNCSDR